MRAPPSRPARETLLELLDATRSNGRPAYSLRQAAATALLKDPVRIQAFRRQSASPSQGEGELQDLVDLGLLPRRAARRWLAANERAEAERTRPRAAEPDIEHELGRERPELEAAPGHQPAARDEPGEGRDPLPFSPQPRTVRVGGRHLLLFPDTPAGEEARFAHYEQRRLVAPPHSILDSNDVRRGRLTALEREHFRRMGR